MKRKFVLGLMLLAISGLVVKPVLAQDKGAESTDKAPVMTRPQVQMGKHDVSRPLRDVQPIEPQKGEGYAKEPRPYLLKGEGQGGKCPSQAGCEGHHAARRGNRQAAADIG